jgi:L-ascorbate metabolism protein UlaG (beta-lactamase superfamily)
LKYTAAGAGTALGGASWWIAVSKQRAARYARGLVADSRRQILPAPNKPMPALWSDNKLTISWLGHATTLINFYGIHIITDPALSNRVGISLGLGTAGPKRYVAPALRFNELPRIDVILVSHAHYDHLDLATLCQFLPNTLAVTARSTTDLLSSAGLKNVTELAWNERTSYRGPNGDLEIQAVQVKHWGQRWPGKTARGYNGYIMRREGKALIFGGDTALATPLFAELRSRGPFAAALMPIGAYQPWIWNHCTPEQAVEMANAARADYIVPIHHLTFKLSDEPRGEPIERLEAALQQEPERLALRHIGETFTIG